MIKAEVTINLTVVDSKGKFNQTQDLKNKVAHTMSGITYGSSNEIIDVTANLNLTVVSDIDKAAGTDYIIALVDDIPAQETSEGFMDPVGLAMGEGDVGAVERKTSNDYTNDVILHELGHIMNAKHSENSFMNKSIDTDASKRRTNNNHTIRRQMYRWISPMPGGTYKNRLGTAEDSREELIRFIKNSNIQ